MQTSAVKYKPFNLKIIDQTLLPSEFKYIDLATLQDSVEAIKSLRVRGAPLIGIVAAYTVVLCAHRYSQSFSARELFLRLNSDMAYLESSRPTAVNLSWAINRMRTRINSLKMEIRSGDEIVNALNTEAIKIHQEDKEACRKIGLNGLKILSGRRNILTHCNTGSLATGGWGTALGVVYAAQEAGMNIHVYVDETRPLGQGARLTVWELIQNNIPCTLITDSTAAALMMNGSVDIVLFGADRIARNGDVANKVGSYSLALSAAAHNIPCYSAAPSSTFDLSLTSGKNIPIEQRESKEILQFYKYDRKISRLINTHNQAFDVTPVRLLSGIITERGILKPPIAKAITKQLT